jgi:uncharacterized protein (TIGR03435 family)
MPGKSGLDRPVLDRTGISGTFDLSVERAPEVNGPAPPGVDVQPDAAGPTFQETLKQQLGLKLEPQKGLVDVIVLDHVERPTEN